MKCEKKLPSIDLDFGLPKVESVTPMPTTKPPKRAETEAIMPKPTKEFEFDEGDEVIIKMTKIKGVVEAIFIYDGRACYRVDYPISDGTVKNSYFKSSDLELVPK